MISLQSKVHVAGVRSTQLIDFMLNCFSPGFERALDEHAQAEFPMLGEMLRDRARRQA